MPEPALTPRQQEIVDFIRESTARNGFAPTVREIGGAFGIKSPNGVETHLKALERKGVIVRNRLLARSIRVVGDDPATRLHDAIMNLPCEVPIAMHTPAAYSAGFHAARHAAAKLVLRAK